jgi:alpha-tubulin suppressor-like RCC1 family protein
MYGAVGAGFNTVTGSQTIYEPTPVSRAGVLSNVQIVQIDIYDGHTLALSSAGDVYSWGRNTNGKI